MPKRKCNHGEPRLRKSARLEEKLQHPTFVPVQKARREGVLPLPLSSGSTTDNHHQTLLQGRSIKPSTKNKHLKSDIETTPGHLFKSAAVRKRKREEGPTQVGKRTWRKVAKPSQEQREHQGQIAAATHINITKSSSEKRPGAVEEKEGSEALDAISHWAVHNTWPNNLSKRDMTMSQGTSSKRKSESTHRSDRLERMAEHGVFMKSSALMKKSSREFCSKLLTGNRIPYFPCFPAEKISEVLERVDGLNEGRIQRDIMPWVVPSAEKLFLYGELDLDYIGDEVQAEWTRCATMGSTRPKPDSANGLLRKAFTKEELKKLRNYASPIRPFFFTPELCFPFLICEAKSGEEGLNKANRQNIHSASIAVRAIIELYWAAFGKASAQVKELYGTVLVFTVSHNSSQVNLYGHFALPTDGSAEGSAEGSTEGLEFYRYEIAMYSLSMFDGSDRYKPYNFICNLFDWFVPKHLQRIKDAAAALPASQPTGVSFSASRLELDESSQDDAGFRKPALPTTALYEREIGLLQDQMERQRSDYKEQMEQQRRDYKEQMEEQRKQQQEREKRMEEQMEEQRKQMEEQRKQMEEQRKQMDEQQKEIISLLKKLGAASSQH